MNKKNIIKVFSNEVFGEIRTLEENDEVYFIGKDVAEALGYTNTRDALNKHVDEEDKAKVAIHDGSQNREMTVINESGIYSLIFGSKLPEAKSFKRWVTSEVLPILRKSGVVVLEHATEEAIDFQSKYGSRRIRKTFNESNDIRATYDEYYRLSKIERDAKRINNKDRIALSKIVINTLEDKIANEALSMRPSELLAIQELLTDIQSDITRLNNKRNGGIKSAQTKRINQLEASLTDDDEYYFIDRHPFSNNYMYSYGKDGVIKSPAYLRWINNLHLDQYLPQEIPGVDFSQPLRLKLLYGHRKAMDTVNFNKSIIDQVAAYYNFNDSLVCECIESLHDYVDSYDEGYIYISIENI